MELPWGRSRSMVARDEALVGRSSGMRVAERHLVLGTEMKMAAEAPLEEVLFGMGCFWGAERVFWQMPGVVVTAVGYAGGFTENPTYDEVCSGRTGHAEVVRVVYDPAVVSFAELLRIFFESHDPTQLMRQGNDVGSPYRSVILAGSDAQVEAAHRVAATFSDRLRSAGFGAVVTQVIAYAELATSVPFFFAEDYHQQYLAKNPNGYCGLGGTGVSCPVGLVG